MSEERAMLFFLNAGRKYTYINLLGHVKTIYLYVERETFHSPLALAGMENQILVVLGADSELMLCWVEDVEQQMTLAGAVDRRRHKN